MKKDFWLLSAFSLTVLSLFSYQTVMPRQWRDTTISRLRRPKKDIQRMSAHEKGKLDSEPIFKLNYEYKRKGLKVKQRY